MGGGGEGREGAGGGGVGHESTVSRVTMWTKCKHACSSLG